MIQLLIHTEIPALPTMITIQLNVEDGTLPILAQWNNAALALEDHQESALMISLPLILMETLANGTLNTQEIADSMMTTILMPLPNAAAANHTMVLLAVSMT